jgi:hypothetical protein
MVACNDWLTGTLLFYMQMTPCGSVWNFTVIFTVLQGNKWHYFHFEQNVGSVRCNSVSSVSILSAKHEARRIYIYANERSVFQFLY